MSAEAEQTASSTSDCRCLTMYASTPETFRPRPHVRPGLTAAGHAHQFRQDSDVVKGMGTRALQPVGVQTMRAGGSSPRLRAASTGLRPCVLRASRVSSETEPRSSWSIDARETSTVVETSRPSRFVDLIDQDALMLFELGGILTDSLTLHARSDTTVTLLCHLPSIRRLRSCAEVERPHSLAEAGVRRF
jgi:hypothetical protein